MTTSLQPIESLVLGESAGSYSLVISPQTTLSFDRSGRPTGLYQNGLYTARGLDGRCLEKKWVWENPNEARRHIRELPEHERQEMHQRVLHLLHSARSAVPDLAHRRALRCYDRGKEYPAEPASAIKTLDFLTQGVEKAWVNDPERFSRIWHPLGVLPPDQYLALVIQVVEGCAWNQCSFCNFYASRPSRVRRLEEIRRHTDEAATFFGPALAGRCSIFLGDANAFQAPADLLIPVAEELALRFPRLATPQPDGVGGIYSFAEATRLVPWRTSDLQALARAGYRRAYLGVETGSDSLRRVLNKPGTSATVLEGIAKLKGAGITVGLILLLGPGGREISDAHIAGTTSLLNQAPLGPGDMIYFSPLVVDSESDYTLTGAAQGWTALNDLEAQAQRRAIEARVPPRGERRAHYDIREFLY